MKKNKILSIVVVTMMIFTCLFVFIGCKDKEEKEDINKPDLEKITFLLDWAPNTNHTGLYVAKALGYYEEEGLDVEFVQPGNMGTSASVASGTAQFGIDFQEQMIFHETEKVNVTAVAAIIQHNTSGLVSVKSKGIDSAAKMEGKTYATWEAPGEQAIVKNMMVQAGADPIKLDMVPKFVENIVVEFSPENKTGVDLVWSFAGWDLVKLSLAGIETNFIEMRNIEGLDYYTPVIVTNNQFKEDHPDKVRAFLRATTKGYTYAINNPKEAADLLIELNPELGVDKELIYESAKYLAKEYQSDAKQWGYIDHERWDGFFNLICSMSTSENGLPKDITDGFGFTNAFLPDIK